MSDTPSTSPNNKINLVTDLTKYKNNIKGFLANKVQEMIDGLKQYSDLTRDELTLIQEAETKLNHQMAVELLEESGHPLAEFWRTIADKFETVKNKLAPLLRDIIENVGDVREKSESALTLFDEVNLVTEKRQEVCNLLGISAPSSSTPPHATASSPSPTPSVTVPPKPEANDEEIHINLEGHTFSVNLKNADEALVKLNQLLDAGKNLTHKPEDSVLDNILDQLDNIMNAYFANDNIARVVGIISKTLEEKTETSTPTPSSTTAPATTSTGAPQSTTTPTTDETVNPHATTMPPVAPANSGQPSSAPATPAPAAPTAPPASTIEVQSKTVTVMIDKKSVGLSLFSNNPEDAVKNLQGLTTTISGATEYDIDHIIGGEGLIAGVRSVFSEGANTDVDKALSELAKIVDKVKKDFEKGATDFLKGEDTKEKIMQRAKEGTLDAKQASQLLRNVNLLIESQHSGVTNLGEMEEVREQLKPVQSKLVELNNWIQEILEKIQTFGAKRVQGKITDERFLQFAQDYLITLEDKKDDEKDRFMAWHYVGSLLAMNPNPETRDALEAIRKLLRGEDCSVELEKARKAANVRLNARFVAEASPELESRRKIIEDGQEYDIDEMERYITKNKDNYVKHDALKEDILFIEQAVNNRKKLEEHIAQYLEANFVANLKQRAVEGKLGAGEVDRAVNQLRTLETEVVASRFGSTNKVAAALEEVREGVEMVQGWVKAGVDEAVVLSADNPEAVIAARFAALTQAENGSKDWMQQMIQTRAFLEAANKALKGDSKKRALVRSGMKKLREFINREAELLDTEMANAENRDEFIEELQDLSLSPENKQALDALQRLYTRPLGDDGDQNDVTHFFIRFAAELPNQLLSKADAEKYAGAINGSFAEKTAAIQAANSEEKNALVTALKGLLNELPNVYKQALKDEVERPKREEAEQTKREEQAKEEKEKERQAKEEAHRPNPKEASDFFKFLETMEGMDDDSKAVFQGINHLMTGASTDPRVKGVLVRFAAPLLRGAVSVLEESEVEDGVKDILNTEGGIDYISAADKIKILRGLDFMQQGDEKVIAVVQRGLATGLNKKLRDMINVAYEAMESERKATQIRERVASALTHRPDKKRVLNEYLPELLTLALADENRRVLVGIAHLLSQSSTPREETRRLELFGDLMFAGLRPIKSEHLNEDSAKAKLDARGPEFIAPEDQIFILKHLTSSGEQELIKTLGIAINAWPKAIKDQFEDAYEAKIAAEQDTAAKPTDAQRVEFYDSIDALFPNHPELEETLVAMRAIQYGTVPAGTAVSHSGQRFFDTFFNEILPLAVAVELGANTAEPFSEKLEKIKKATADQLKSAVDKVINTSIPPVHQEDLKRAIEAIVVEKEKHVVPPTPPQRGKFLTGISTIATEDNREDLEIIQKILSTPTPASGKPKRVAEMLKKFVSKDLPNGILIKLGHRENEVRTMAFADKLAAIETAAIDKSTEVQAAIAELMEHAITSNAEVSDTLMEAKKAMAPAMTEADRKRFVDQLKLSKGSKKLRLMYRIVTGAQFLEDNDADARQRIQDHFLQIMNTTLPELILKELSIDEKEINALPDIKKMERVVQEVNKPGNSSKVGEALERAIAKLNPSAQAVLNEYAEQLPEDNQYNREVEEELRKVRARVEHSSMSESEKREIHKILQEIYETLGSHIEKVSQNFKPEKRKTDRKTLEKDYLDELKEIAKIKNSEVAQEQIEEALLDILKSFSN